MLRLENLNLSLGKKKILEDVTFDLKEGELLCLLGPSGCGKTSTLRAIAGLETPDSGFVQLNGKTVSNRNSVTPPYERDIGFLFQDFALFPHLTVAENISYGLSKLSKTAAKNRTEELLQQIGLSEQAKKYPHMLSGGEQQRVALARARAPEPRLLLLDEPFSGLDVSLRQQIREETIQILKENEIASIIVTHDPEEAMLFADKIVLMQNGRVIQKGSPNTLYTNPINSFSAEFFGDISRIEGSVIGDMITTEIGSFSNKNFPNGSRVDVLIRQDGLRINPSKSDTQSEIEVRVCDVRYTGTSNLVKVGIGDWPSPHTHLLARHPSRFALEHGQKINLEVDPDSTFIFLK